MDEQERSCFGCRYKYLCFLKVRINEALVSGIPLMSGVWHRDQMPEAWAPIFCALAKICSAFEFKEEKT